MNRAAVRLVLASLAGIISAGAAQAQSADARWPEQPIRCTVPVTAGSSSDTVARLVAQQLGERLGQQLVVENRVGGGGSLGTAEVARAEADAELRRRILNDLEASLAAEGVERNSALLAELRERLSST